LKAFEFYGCRGHDEGQNKVAIILGQELHASGHDWIDVQHHGRSHGWAVQGALATPGEEGKWKAGVCVAARCHYGLAKAGSLAHDISPKGSPGRLCVAWVDGVIKGGLMVLSTYLWHSEGLTERNRQLLEVAVQAIRGFGGAWLLL